MNSRKIIWIGRALSFLVVLPFVLASSMKLLMRPEVLQGLAHFGLPESLVRVIGFLEILCVIIYLIPSTSILGAILFTGFMGGTIVTHLRVGEPVYLQFFIGVMIWLGLYLREARLRVLLPIRKARS